MRCVTYRNRLRVDIISLWFIAWKQWYVIYAYCLKKKKDENHTSALCHLIYEFFGVWCHEIKMGTY